MHVLLVSTFFPYPQNCGKARVLGGFCAFLRQHPRVRELTYFQIAREPAADRDAIGAAYHHAPGPGWFDVVRNLGRALRQRRWPALQEVLTYSRTAHRQLHEFIRTRQPDLVIVDTIRAAQYLETEDRPAARYFIYLDDLFSVRYERMLHLQRRMPGAAIDALGNFASFVPRLLRPLAAQPVFARALLRYERRAVQRREDEVVHRFERSFLINPDEAKLLRARTGVDSIHALKLLTEAPAQSAWCDGSGRYFVFLGDLRLAHNHHAILHLVREGGRLLAERLPGYRVVIVGKAPPPELVEACRSTPGFELAGFVPDLAALLRHSRGLLAPLLFGSGVKIKCIEALRWGVPIVATDYGVEGLGLRAGLDYLAAEDTDGVVRQMERLCDNREHARLVRAGRRWFESNYAPAVVWSEYERLLLDAQEEECALLPASA